MSIENVKKIRKDIKDNKELREKIENKLKIMIKMKEI